MLYFILNPPRDKSGSTQERMWINYMESWLNNLHLSLLMNFNHTWHTNHCNSSALMFQIKLSSNLAAIQYWSRELAGKSLPPWTAHIQHTTHRRLPLYGGIVSCGCRLNKMRSWPIRSPWLNVLKRSAPTKGRESKVKIKSQNKSRWWKVSDRYNQTGN